MTSSSPELLRQVQQWAQIRKTTEKICYPLEVDDFGIQSIPEVSPPKWHLAHTTWFVEEFLLARLEGGHKPFEPGYRYLFNSYYESAGPHLERSQRGLISRPTVKEILRYRSFIDEMLLSSLGHGQIQASEQELELLLELAIEHEEQHQELLFTDIKHILWSNPSKPAYREDVPTARPAALAPEWIPVEGGLYEIGAEEGSRFAFDNERPRHPVYLSDFEISSVLVTNGEYLEFVKSGGYRDSQHWLSNGWDQVQHHRWEAPLYWIVGEKHPTEMTLAGIQPLNLADPVIHISYYEADAYARWRGARLPTEAEWEIFARASWDSCELPHAPERQLWGTAWQWTSSAYGPYPGFRPLGGAFAEYNGKFMCNQMVLRGSSSATPRKQARVTYRNFFPPDARWQFSGIRLAR